MRHRTTDTAKGHRNYIIIACDVLLFLAMLKWLPVEPDVARGLAVLTFIGILWLTEALHVTVTALLVPVLAMFMGILPGAKALAGFADPTIFLFFGGFALAGALHEQKIDTWLAGKILRMARGSLGMALILIFLATAFLSMWMSNTATAAMMLPLVIGLLDRIPAEKLKTTAPFAVLGVAYSASIGGMGTLVGSPPNAIAAHELGMGFAEWFRIAMPIVLVFGVIVFCLMYLFFRPRLGLHVDMAPAEGEVAEARLNARQVRVLLLFVLVAGSWMCSSFLSSALGGIPSMDTLIALCAAVLLPLCGVINWGGIAKNTDWGVLLLFGGGITLSSILVQTGGGGISGGPGIFPGHGAESHYHPAHHQPLHHVADGILLQYGQRSPGGSVDGDGGLRHGHVRHAAGASGGHRGLLCLHASRLHASQRPGLRHREIPSDDHGEGRAADQCGARLREGFLGLDILDVAERAPVQARALPFRACGVAYLAGTAVPWAFSWSSRAAFLSSLASLAIR